MKKFNQSSVITTVLVVLAFFLLNWVSYGAFWRADLSAEGLLRMSGATKDILRKLPQKLRIEAFLSDDVPENEIRTMNNITAFLEEFESASDGQVKLLFLDPDGDESAASRAAELNVQPVTNINQSMRKGLNIKPIYRALALTYGDQKEILPNVLEVKQLEANLINTIYKLAFPGERGVGILKTETYTKVPQSGFPGFLQSFALIGDISSQIYGDFIEVDAKTADISENVRNLIIPTPDSLEEIEKYRIDQFILRGGNVILAVGGMKLDMRQFIASPTADDIVNYFKQYGIAINKDMVNDGKRYLPFPVPNQALGRVEQKVYPVWVIAEEMNEEHPITSNFEQLFFPWASSVSSDLSLVPKDKENKPMAKSTILVKSSENAWAQSNFAMVHPMRIEEALKAGPPKTVAKQNLAVLVEGKFSSFFKGKKLPKGASKRNFIADSEREAKILAVGSPFVFTFISNEIIRNPGDLSALARNNAQFFLTTLDIFNGLEDLARTRNANAKRALTSAPSLTQQRVFTILNFVLPLLGFGLLAAFRLTRRKKLSKKQYEPEGSN